MIAVDLSKKEALDADPKGIQQIDFTAKLVREGSARICFIREEEKKPFLNFTRYCKRFVSSIECD